MTSYLAVLLIRLGLHHGVHVLDQLFSVHLRLLQRCPELRNQIRELQKPDFHLLGTPSQLSYFFYLGFIGLDRLLLFSLGIFELRLEVLEICLQMSKKLQSNATVSQ